MPADDDHLPDRRGTNRELERSVTELAMTVRELRAQLVSKEIYASDQLRASDRLSAFNEAQAIKLAATAEASRATLELISERIATVKAANQQTLELVKDLERQRGADRRLILTSMIMPILLIILGAYIASQT